MFLHAAVLSLLAIPVWAQPSAPLSAPPATAQIPMLRDAGLDQKVDSLVPADLAFVVIAKDGVEHLEPQKGNPAPTIAPGP